MSLRDDVELAVGVGWVFLQEWGNEIGTMMEQMTAYGSRRRYFKLFYIIVQYL